MKFGPSLNKARLLSRELAGQQVHGIDGKDGHLFLIVRMEMGRMVLHALLPIHSDNYTEKSADLGHLYFTPEIGLEQSFFNENVISLIY